MNRGRDKPRCTDHAVLRYLERVKGFNIESIRAHILQICAPAIEAGATSVRVEGAVFELDHGCVITVAPGGPGVCKTKRERFAGSRT